MSMPVLSSVVLLSGTPVGGSRVERIGAWCADYCVAAGGSAALFRGGDLDFPYYRPDRPERDARQRRYLAALAGCDGVVLLSPAYHGAMSGLLKNALDYVNDLAGEDRPFLDGRAVGCVAVAQGDQGATTTLATLRIVAHALRGWPTPLGVALAGDRAEVTPAGEPGHPRCRDQLRLMLDQVLGMAGPAGDRRVRPPAETAAA
jgi:NAD(P)H-dependent FMN reductase